MESTPQTTDEASVTAVEPWHAPLSRVTTLSKITAAVVFITLPFVGFWLGYRAYSVTEALVRTQNDLAISPSTTVPIVSAKEYQISDKAITVGGYRNVVSRELAVDMINYVDGQMVLPEIMKQYDEGYVRFQNPGFYFSIPSNYLIKGNDVYYSSIDFQTGVVDTPVLLLPGVDQFEVIHWNEVAYDGKTVYVYGEPLVDTDFVKLEGFPEKYIVTKSAVYAVYKESTPLFTNVDGQNFVPIKEIWDKYETVYETRHRWFTDGKRSYCPFAGDSTENIPPVSVEGAMKLLFVVGKVQGEGRKLVDSPWTEKSTGLSGNLYLGSQNGEYYDVYDCRKLDAIPEPL